MVYAVERAKQVKLVILDVDGVQTDGGVIIDSNGVQQAKFHIRDGLGVVTMIMTGLEVAIITSRRSPIVQARADELGIKRLYQGAKKKTEVYATLLEELGITDENVAYVGDDLVDLGIMKRVGLAIAVADAVPEVKAVAHYVTEVPGGKGAVREAAELILKAQGKWEKVLAKLG